MIDNTLLRSAAFAAFTAAALPAFAAEATLVCTNAGNMYKVGEYACIPACHGRQRYARCDAVAESPTWTYISDVCPMALFTPKDPAASFQPVRTAMSPIPYDIPVNAIAPEFAERIAQIGDFARDRSIPVTTLASR